MFHPFKSRSSSAFAPEQSTANSYHRIAAGALQSALLCITASVLSASAAAEEQVIQEIQVFSSLDHRSLADFTGSISIIDAALISSRNAQHIDQILATVPNTNFSGGASRGRFVQIRGIGDIEQFVDPKPYPSVSLAVDGIELNGLFASGLLFDAAQVEVLRGPQGTRLGSSALAGSINIVSTDPSAQNSNFVEVGVGKFSALQYGGAIGGEITSALSGRVAVQQYSSDGYIDNEFLNRDDTGEFDELIAKTKLRWSIDDKNSLGLSVIHTNVGNGYDAFSLTNTRNTTFSDMPGHDRQEVTGVAITSVNTLTDSITLESKISWLTADLDYAFDEDWTDPGICVRATCIDTDYPGFDRYEREREEYIVDIRILGEQFVLGLYAQDRQTDLDRNRIGSLPLSTQSKYDSERYAAYAQWTPQISNRASASLGGRFETFSDDYRDSNAITTDSNDDLWSVDASINFALSDQIDLFAIVSRGNKAGGVNTDAISNFNLLSAINTPELANRLRYESESLTNIEIGSILSLLGKRLTIRPTAFYNKRNNPQFETFIFDSAFIGYQDNADSAESAGVELSIDYQINPAINLASSVGYIDSSIKNLRVFDFDLFAFTTIDSKEQARASSYQYHIAANIQLSEAALASIQLEGRDGYQFAYYFDEESSNINLLHASFEYAIDNFTLTLWMRNILDENYPTQGLYFGNDPRDNFTTNLYTQAGEPRNAGVNLRFTF